jgi:hypothetical protein
LGFISHKVAGINDAWNVQIKKPDPVIFARTILFEMAQTHAIVSCLADLFLDDIGVRCDLDAADKADFRKKFWSRVEERTKKAYSLHAREVGVPIKEEGQGESGKHEH